MNIKDIIEAIKGMTVLEINELVEACEEEFGVTAVVAAGGAGAAAADAPAAEEQTEFDVILKEFGATKVKVIKEVRGITGLSLKEAKALVDEAPSTIKEAVDKAEAEEMKKKLEEAGAVVELK